MEDLLPMLLEDKDFYETSGGGVTLSGGECLCQADFCAEIKKRLKEEGIRTAIDTCGFVPKESIDKVIPYTDIFLYDIKAIEEEIHIKCTGRSNKLIIENLKYIDDCGKSIQIRIPYVPGYNSDQIDKMIESMEGLKNLTKVRVLTYHKHAGLKYLTGRQPSFCMFHCYDNYKSRIDCICVNDSENYIKYRFCKRFQTLKPELLSQGGEMFIFQSRIS